MAKSLNKKIVQVPEQGFTLIELSIVLVITSLILVGAIQAFQIFNEKQKIERMNLLMTSIDQSISNFPTKINSATGMPYGRLPCPAPMNGSAAGNNYNAEDCAIVPVNGTAGAPVLIGKIPAATLGLSSAMMRDIHGHYLIYAVTLSSTVSATYSTTAGAIQVVDEGEDLSLPPTTIPDVRYVVVSMGNSGTGAYAFDGTQPIACADGASKDGENCDGNATFIASVRSDPGNARFYDDRINFVSSLTSVLGAPPICTGVGKALQFDGTNWQCIDADADAGAGGGGSSSCSNGHYLDPKTGKIRCGTAAEMGSNR
jgi:prepilin-type N-terminal cleavage/methylation domain-containing protein